MALSTLKISKETVFSCFIVDFQVRSLYKADIAWIIHASEFDAFRSLFSSDERQNARLVSSFEIKNHIFSE